LIGNRRSELWQTGFKNGEGLGRCETACVPRGDLDRYFRSRVKIDDRAGQGEHTLIRFIANRLALTPTTVKVTSSPSGSLTSTRPIGELSSDSSETKISPTRTMGASLNISNRPYVALRVLLPIASIETDRTGRLKSIRSLLFGVKNEIPPEEKTRFPPTDPKFSSRDSIANPIGPLSPVAVVSVTPG